MTAQDFAGWLNGYFELSGSETLTSDQVKLIKNKLAVLFPQKSPSPNYHPILNQGIINPQVGVFDPINQKNWVIGT